MKQTRRTEPLEQWLWFLLGASFGVSMVIVMMYLKNLI